MDTLPQDIAEKMEKDLLQYETSRGIDVNYTTFSLLARYKTGTVVGVIVI